MKKGMALLLCLLLAAGMLSGCADAKEIDDTSFILSLGVDKGTEKTYEISFQLPVLAEEDSPSFRTIVCQAEGLSDAVALLNANTPYRVDFTHLNFLVIGRTLAEEGVGQIIDPLMRMPQVRKGAMVIVAQDTAKKFVQSLQSDENLNLMHLQQSIISEAGTSGIFPNFTLDMFYDSLYEQRGAAVVALGMQSDEAKKPNSGSAISELPGYTMVESSIKSELIGSAVFYDDRMVGTLTGEQTRVWCMATGQFGHGEISLPNPFGEGMLTLKLKQAGPVKTTVNTDGAYPSAQIEVPLNAFLVAYAGTENYETLAKKEEIAAYVQQRLQEDLEEISREFAAWGVDGYSVGKAAAKNFKTQRDWADYQWPKKRKQLQVTVTPSVYVSLYRPALGEER